MIAFFKWWLFVSFVGLTAMPLAFYLLRWLPDRGWSLARAFGLLLVGYVFWLLGTFGFLTGSSGGMLVALAVVAGLSAWAVRQVGWGAMVEWWRENRQVALVVELLFLAAFGLWAYIRALNPEIAATEKPMEFAFLNAIARSPVFPPHDPWLSGYAISYYYFGYIVVGYIAGFTATPMSVAFNLGIALLFGLVAVGAYGVTFNLMALAGRGGSTDRARDAQGKADAEDAGYPASARPRRDRHGTLRHRGSPSPHNSFLAWSLFGPLFVLVIGNLAGFLETLHAGHVGWARPVDAAGGAATVPVDGGFWRWLDIEDLSNPPVGAKPTWLSQRYLWWWRASRVIRDRDLLGNAIGLQPIDEFPFFSFVLGDLHPHVLALPFGLLALGLALNLMHWRSSIDASDGKPGQSVPRVATLAIARLSWPVFILTALILGGLSFLNTWDFPIYLFVVVGAYLLGRARHAGWGAALWGEAVSLGGGLGLAGGLLYLPFYLGFQSQAGGILPNLAFPTRLPQFGVMFGPSLFVIALWLVWLLARHAGRVRWRLVGLGYGLLAFLVLVMAALGLALMARPDVQSAVQSFLGPIDINTARALVISRRLTNPWTALLLATMIGVVAVLTGASSNRGASASGFGPADSRSQGFGLLLVGTGALLTLGPEFLYLRDTFGMRMNTVFKFYYQAWVLWGIAAAFAAWSMFRAQPVAGAGPRLARLLVPIFRMGFIVVVAMGLFYPFLSVWTKTDGLRGTLVMPGGTRTASLDGMAYMLTGRAADYRAIQWIKANIADSPVIAEAVGGSYTDYGRVSAHTGLPTVLGWPGHELQWRGGWQEAGEREGDLERLYRSNDWTETQSVLDKYGIEYVYYGPLEQGKYGAAGQTKFEQYLESVYQAEGVTIFKRR